jgi:hypothetical protein
MRCRENSLVMGKIKESCKAPGLVPPPFCGLQHLSNLIDINV